MKRSRISLLAFTLIAGAAVGQPQKREPMRGVKRGEPRAPLATLVVGVNETAGSIAEPGWPLIVSAARQPDDKPAAVPLPSNLRVKLADEKGVEVTVTFERVSRLAPTNPEAGLYWLAAEAATTRLAPGRFRVSLVPEQGELAGWRVESGEFRVVAPNPERSGLVGLLRVQRWLLLGKEDDALAEADRLITANTKDLHAWIAKGDILMKKDQPDEALQAYDRALGLHKKADGEPLALMQRRRTAFLRSLEKRGVLVREPPPP